MVMEPDGMKNVPWNEFGDFSAVTWRMWVSARPKFAGEPRFSMNGPARPE